MISPIELFNIDYIKNGFAIVGILVTFGYTAIVILKRPFQKRENLSNMEFWVFFALKDMLKDYGYDKEEENALLVINSIKSDLSSGRDFRNRKIDEEKFLIRKT